MKSILIIAGSDSIGGAGLQADIKASTMNGVYSMTAVTVLTAQNTKGVQKVLSIPGEFLKAQIDSVFSDIIPDAVKIGMVPSKELVEIIVERLNFYSAKNVVVDPVMICTSGYKVMTEEQIEGLTEKLFPISKVITPNVFEAQVLSNEKINSNKDLLPVAKKISEKYSCNVFLKGGHFEDNADDLLYLKNGEHHLLKSEHIDNPNIHGTGCTLSSAIASNLAKGEDLFTSVSNAKKYVKKAILKKLSLVKVNGPIDHTACRDFLG